MTKRRAIPTALRKAVLESGGREAAQLCGKPSTTLEVDHHLAVTFGGTNDQGNLRALCQGCHSPKSRQETTDAAKADRIRKKRLGIQPQRWRRKIGWQDRLRVSNPNPETEP